MNIQFKPEPKAGQILSAKLGSNLTVSFKIRSNPVPSNVTWIRIQEDLSYNITSGEETEKYSAKKIEIINDLLFQVDLEIRNVTFEDQDFQNILKVENVLGEQNYLFEINVEL